MIRKLRFFLLCDAVCRKTSHLKVFSRFAPHCTRQIMLIWLCWATSFTLSRREKDDLICDARLRPSKVYIIWMCTSYFLDSSAQSVCVFMWAWFWWCIQMRTWETCLCSASGSERRASLFHLSVFSLIHHKKQRAAFRDPAAAAAFGIRLFVRPTAAAAFLWTTLMVKYVVWSFD